MNHYIYSYADKLFESYDKEKELIILSELLALRHNLFHPTMKLVGKIREGGKVKNFII